MTITIIGFGNVGRTVALLLIHKFSNQSLNLNIIDFEDAVAGSLLDMGQTISLVNMQCNLCVNDDEMLAMSDIIIYCAGKSVPAGASRRVIRDANIEICEQVFSKKTIHPNAKIIVVSNPVDTISHAVFHFTGLPAHQVFGVGTFLDSVRFRHFAKNKVGDLYNNQSILLGEHGDAVVYMSHYDNLQFIDLKQNDYHQIIKACLDDTKNSATIIKKTQEASYYAVAACVLDMVAAINDDSKVILPLSVALPSSLKIKWQIPGQEIFMSLPVSLGATGIHQYHEIRASREEWEALKVAAFILKELQLQEK